jgi:hypothetical protein
MTLRGRPTRSASTLYARAAASSVVCRPRYVPVHVTFHLFAFLTQLTPANCEVLVASRCLTGAMPSSWCLRYARAASSSVV